jgi:hypothetical protein
LPLHPKFRELTFHALGCIKRVGHEQRGYPSALSQKARPHSAAIAASVYVAATKR